jgi:hypothetical protein
LSLGIDFPELLRKHGRTFKLVARILEVRESHGKEICCRSAPTADERHRSLVERIMLGNQSALPGLIMLMIVFL